MEKTPRLSARAPSTRGHRAQMQRPEPWVGVWVEGRSRVRLDCTSRDVGVGWHVTSVPHLEREREGRDSAYSCV